MSVNIFIKNKKKKNNEEILHVPQHVLDPPSVSRGR